MQGVHQACSHCPIPSPGTPGLARWGSPHTQVPGACKEPAPHPCILFQVSRAAATGTAGAGRAPRGFAQEQVCEAGRERASCRPGFHAVPLGGPEAHAAPQPAASGCAHHISVWGLRCRGSGEGGARGLGGPGAPQGPEVSWDLPFHTRRSRFDHRPGLETAPAHTFHTPAL